MQKHTKIYFNHFGYTVADFVPCEVCSQKATEIHHINPKRMGGSKTKDYIENLMAICRTCHIKAHSEILKIEYLKDVHKNKMQAFKR